jgi:hypothetical protein
MLTEPLQYELNNPDDYKRKGMTSKLDSLIQIELTQ